MKPAPFEGVRILDFAQGAVGPIASRWFGDFGADIIHVETHLWIEADRAEGPSWGGVKDVNRRWWFNCWHACKRSATINLRNAKGQDLVKRLIGEWKPNILIESFSPGTIGRLGLDYATVRQIRPEIIFLSTALEGQTGPHSNRMGYGNVGSAVAGIKEITGWPDRGPSTVYGPYSDFCAATLAHAVVAGALLRQKRTGKGVYIDLSQSEAVIGLLATPIMDYLTNGRVMRRPGNRNLHAAPHGPFPCKGEDRWVAITVFSGEEWKRFCTALGNPEWTNDARFANFESRKSNEDDLELLVAEWTRNFTAEQVEAIMQTAGVAASVLANGKDFMEDPQVQCRNALREMEFPNIGRIHISGPSIELSECRDAMYRAPLMGEHTRDILGGILKLSEEEMNVLTAEKVITTDADLRR